MAPWKRAPTTQPLGSGASLTTRPCRLNRWRQFAAQPGKAQVINVAAGDGSSSKRRSRLSKQTFQPSGSRASAPCIARPHAHTGARSLQGHSGEPYGARRQRGTSRALPPGNHGGLASDGGDSRHSLCQHTCSCNCRWSSQNGSLQWRCNFRGGTPLLSPGALPGSAPGEAVRVLLQTGPSGGSCLQWRPICLLNCIPQLQRW